MRAHRTSRRVCNTLFAGLTAALIAALGVAGCQSDGPMIPKPRPTVIVITSTGPYTATFDDAGDWLIGKSEEGVGHVADGKYLLSVTEASHLAWTTQQRVFGEGVYEVEATLLSGPEASGFGLLLLGSSDLSSFFYCMITGDGRYDIGYCQDSCDTQESLIGGYTLAYTILADNQTNFLRVELADGRLTFLVNGAPVGQVNGLGYTSGLVGLIGESSPYGGFEAAFDNLSVREGTP
jgi:hypothetical protein